MPDWNVLYTSESVINRQDDLWTRTNLISSLTSDTSATVWSWLVFLWYLILNSPLVIRKSAHVGVIPRTPVHLFDTCLQFNKKSNHRGFTGDYSEFLVLIYNSIESQFFIHFVFIVFTHVFRNCSPPNPGAGFGFRRKIF